MATIESTKNVEELTLTFVAEFSAPVARVWQVWEDPRQLERWWGPPTWPATFKQHDFAVDGRSSYYMTGPEGEKAWGWWRMTAIDRPNRLEFEDGFADENGDPDTTIPPAVAVVTLEAIDNGTRMTTVTQFVSEDQMNQMLSMGMQEGMTLAMGQIEDVLLENAGV
ncbi:SRPBCC domain-containing protein [soil metagenome]